MLEQDADDWMDAGGRAESPGADTMMAYLEGSKSAGVSKPVKALKG